LDSDGIEAQFLHQPDEPTMATPELESAAGRMDHFDQPLEPEQATLGEIGASALGDVGKIPGPRILRPVRLAVEVPLVVGDVEMFPIWQCREHGGPAAEAPAIMRADRLVQRPPAPTAV